MLGPGLAEEEAEFGGGVAEMGEKTCLHVDGGHALGVAAEVDGGNDAASR